MNEPAAPDSPLRATLGRVRAVEDSLAVEVGIEAGAGWVRTVDLAADGEATVRAVLELYAGRGAHEPRIQAAWFVQGYTWLLTTPAAACYLAERRVPSLDPDNVAFRVGGDLGHVGVAVVEEERFAALGGDLAASSAAVRVPSEGALLAWLRRTLDANLETVFSLESLAPLGRRARWAIAADATASAFLWAGERLDRVDEACRALESFLDLPGSLRSPSSLFTVARAGKTATVRRRRSCCLAYRVAGLDYCATCPLVPFEESQARVRRQLEIE